MKDIRMTKAVVIERLVAARAEHSKIVEEAIEGYRVQAVKTLNEMLKQAKAGKIQQFYWPHALPMDNTKEFDRAISMLEDSLDDEVLLSESDYRIYMRNEWAWRDQFLTSNSFYSSTARDSIG